MKPWAVMCCACRKLLCADGSKTDAAFKFDTTSGFVDTTAMATFASHAEADVFALAHGWQVEDTKGPNHRCPECKETEARSKKAKAKQRPEGQRGAYVNLEDIFGPDWYNRVP